MKIKESTIKRIIKETVNDSSYEGYVESVKNMSDSYDAAVAAMEEFLNVEARAFDLFDKIYTNENLSDEQKSKLLENFSYYEYAAYHIDKCLDKFDN
jgi:hypothetical protein